MNNHVHELLSRSLDEPLEPAEAAILEEALARSAELRALREDLVCIKKIAATAPAAMAPDLPESLAERVAATYAGKSKKVVPFLRLLRHPLTLAAALLVCIGLGYFLVERSDSQPSEVARASYDDIRTDVLKAQEQFHQAVAKLEEAAMERIAVMPPDLAHHFAHNLNIIDQAIRDCEKMTDKYLDSHLNYAALAKAYQAKVQLLQLILES
jgi:hypothetical protein